MAGIDVERTKKELLMAYPGARVKVAPDMKEVVAEVSETLAVAVIERSEPHFHLKTQEIYRGLRGRLHVACAGQGHVLREGDELVIEPGQIHFARALGEPAWIEVVSRPPWSEEDYLVL